MGKFCKHSKYLIITILLMTGLTGCDLFQNGEPYEGFADNQGRINNDEVSVVFPLPAEPNSGHVESYERYCEVAASDLTSEIRSIGFFVENAETPDRKFIALQRQTFAGTVYFSVEWTSPNYSLDYGSLQIDRDLILHSVMTSQEVTTVLYYSGDELRSAPMICVNNEFE